jgi:hypothetical protein
MQIYIFITIFLIICSFFEIFVSKKKGNNVLLFVIAAFLVLFAGTRLCGFDYYTYFDEYYRLNSFSLKRIFSDYQFEPFYILLNMVAPSFNFLVFFVALISIPLILYFIKKNSPFPFFSIFLFFTSLFLLSEMGQVRQAIALSFSVWASFYINDKKKFIFFALIAIMSHYSAGVILLFMVIPQKIKSLSFYSAILVISIFLAFFLKGYISKMVGYMPSFIGGKVDIYTENETWGFSAKLAFFNLCIFLMSFFLLSSKKDLDKRMPFFLNCFFVSLCIQVAFASVPQIAGRGALYYSIYAIIIIPSIVKEVRVTKNQLPLFFIFVILYLYVFISFLTTWSKEYIPYKSLLIS